MRSHRPTQAHAIVAASGSNNERREQEPIPFLSSRRIRMNIRAVIDDKEMWLTPAYSLAIQAEHLLQVIEGKRKHTKRVRLTRTYTKWGSEKRAELLADPRTHAELAEVYGVSPSAISQQRNIARREAAA